MDEPRTWRELLGDIISDPSEKQRLASELGVNSITLTRWVNNESNPRPHSLRQLVRASPQNREILSRFIDFEFPGMIDIDIDSSLPSEEEIPSVFYARVLHTYRNTPPFLRFRTTVNIIFQQALMQLDPHRMGMAITIMKCMLPSEDYKIRSLRPSAGRGTPPWEFDLEQKVILLGSESLEGYCVLSCQPVVVQSLGEGKTLLPSYQTEWEQSKAIYPILRAGHIAGCLAFSSTQTNYFTNRRLTQIEIYADLVSLAFEDSDFYPLESIDLRVMPSPSIQSKYFANFNKRLADTLIQAAHDGRSLKIVQAEEIVWQQLEAEILMLSHNQKVT